MKKQELIHLHDLCTELRQFLEKQDEIGPHACSDYDALNINPMAINQQKDAHLEAVMTLLADITTSFEEEHTDNKPKSVLSKQTPTDA